MLGYIKERFDSVRSNLYYIQWGITENIWKKSTLFGRGKTQKQRMLYQTDYSFLVLKYSDTQYDIVERKVNLVLEDMGKLINVSKA